MKHQSFDRLHLGQQATYQVQVQGRINEGLADWLEVLTVSIEPVEDATTITTITGIVQDQASLHGMLSRIRDLGIPLLSVQLVNPPILRKRSEQDGKQTT